MYQPTVDMLHRQHVEMRRARRAVALADRATERGVIFSCRRAQAVRADFPELEQFFAHIDHCHRRACHYLSRARRLYHHAATLNCRGAL